MEHLNSILVVFFGLLARFGLPIVVTLLIIFWMRHMDEQWKEQAEQEQALNISRAKNPGCWKINNCSPDRRSVCPAFSNPDIPYWQVHRYRDGQLLDTCLGCQVFQKALVPA